MNNYRVPLFSLSVILVELLFGMRLKELPEFSKAPGERQSVENWQSCPYMHTSRYYETMHKISPRLEREADRAYVDAGMSIMSVLWKSTCFNDIQVRDCIQLSLRDLEPRLRNRASALALKSLSQHWEQSLLPPLGIPEVMSRHSIPHHIHSEQPPLPPFQKQRTHNNLRSQKILSFQK